MSTYGEGKINEPCETRLTTVFCLQLSPSGSMGLIGWQREGWPFFSTFFISRYTVAVVLWSDAFFAVAEHESDPPYLYQSSVLSLHCVRGGLDISFCRSGRHMWGGEAETFVCFISWESGLFSVFFFSSEATDAKRRRESVAFMLQRQSSGVTDRWEVVWGDIHLQRWWEESQRSDRFLHTCASFPQGVDPYSSRTDLHELNLRNEWEGCRWGKGPLRRSPCKEKFEAHFEEKALCCGLPGGTTLEIWALFKKSQCRGESDWTSLFVQWVMTAVVREQRGAVLLQLENFLDWINGQFPTWLTPYLPAHLNTVCRSRSRKQQDRLVLIFPSCGQSIYWALWLTFECAQSCDSIDWWLNYHRADRQLLWSFMISFKLVFSHRICLAWRYQGEK